MRDLKADLELCNKATPGPWGVSGSGHSVYSLHIPAAHDESSRIVIAECLTEKDAKFIAGAREGWPEAIKRAMQAEQENAGLKNLFDMQKKRCPEAIKLWQEETGRKEVIPDLGELIKWLMDERAKSIKVFDIARKYISLFADTAHRGKLRGGG